MGQLNESAVRGAPGTFGEFFKTRPLDKTKLNVMNLISTFVIVVIAVYEPFDCFYCSVFVVIASIVGYYCELFHM